MSDWSEQAFLQKIGPLAAIAPELLKVFQDSLAEKMTQLQSTAILQESQHVFTIAHSIKGSAGQVCCSTLAKYASSLESAAQKGLSAEIATAAALLLAQADVDLRLIRAFLAKTG